MSVSETIPAREHYTTNGGTDYPFTFTVYNQAHLAVYQDGILATIDIDYRVRNGALPFSSLTDAQLPANGFIQFLDGAGNVDTLDNGIRISILRDQPVQQASIYQPNEPFPSTVIEQDFDKVVMLLQQLEELSRRSVRARPNEPLDMALPAVAIRASKVLGFDTNGLPLAVPLPTAGGGDLSLATVQSAYGTVLRTLAERFADNVNVKDFGAVGDGLTDDTAAIQAALDTNRPALVPPGKYRITTELIFDPIRNRNTGLIGTSSWSNYSYTSQSGGPTWSGANESIIYYDGAVSATIAVIRASAEPVGTEVASIFDNNIYGFALKNILIDGNSKAGFGVYGARLMEPDVVNVAVRGTTKHAWYINGNYSGKFSKISAVFNSGCGISFGRGALDYGWTLNYTINATVLDDLYATTNGGDKAFDEVTNPLWGYGIGLWLHRGNLVTQYTSELNDGAALVLSPSSGPNLIESGYSELSSGYVVSGTHAITDGRATRAWGIWFVGRAGGASLANSVKNLYMGTEGIQLTGTEPSSGRPEHGFELQNITGANYLISSWANYRLINPSLELVAGMTGTAPTGSQKMLGGLTHITGNGAEWRSGQLTELLTLSTGGATTDTIASLLPANSIIEAVVARVTTTITIATDWKLGDATISGRFAAANSTMTAGATSIGTVHADQTGTSGPRQVAAAKVRVTTTGTPGAGAIRITVFYRQFIAPTN